MMKSESVYFSYLLVIVAHNTFILGFIFANQNALHPIQTNLLRGLATFLINFFLIRYYQMNMEFRLAANHKYLLIRSGTLCLHSLVLALCGFYLPQPVIHTINCTGPIFVIIEDFFINNIKINTRQMKGIVLTFLGIVLTINGESVLSYWLDDREINTITNFENYASKNSLQKIMMGILFAIIAVVWAYGTIVIKNIIELNSFHINLHFGIFSTFICAILYPIFVTEPKTIQIMIYGFFLCGTPMAIGNILFIHALTINHNTGLASICISSGVVFGYIISILRYNESINYICLIGSICIVGGLIIALTTKGLNKDKQQMQVKFLDQNNFRLKDTVYVQMEIQVNCKNPQ